MCKKVMTTDCPKSNFSHILRAFGELADGLKALVPAAKVLDLAAAEHRRIIGGGIAKTNADKLEVWGNYISTLHILADDSPDKDQLYVDFTRRIKEIQNAN